MMSLLERTLKIDAADRQGYLYSKAFEEGQRDGQLVTIERVLVARELPVAASLRARLRECSDERLDRATLLAVTATDRRIRGAAVRRLADARRVTHMRSLAREDRIAGGLLGLLIGDALASPTSSTPPDLRRARRSS